MFQNHEDYRELNLAVLDNRIRGCCWISYDEDESPLAYRCVVDTGAMISAIPQRVWERFADKIDIGVCPLAPIRGVGGRRLKARSAHLHLLVGGKDPNLMPFALGECEVRLVYDRDAADADQIRQLGPGECNEDRIKELQHILLGLGGGPLSQGGVCINWQDQEAVLVQKDH